MAFYEENPGGITRADMVLAIPTFNEAETVGHTTVQAARGLAEYFIGLLLLQTGVEQRPLRLL